MKKINIVQKNKEFQELIKNGNRYFDKYIIVYYIYNQTQTDYKIGISIGKKLGNAVFRNRNKRQVKNIIRNIDFQKTLKCIIIVRSKFTTKTYIEKSQILTNIFKKIRGENEKQK